MILPATADYLLPIFKNRAELINSVCKIIESFESYSKQKFKFIATTGLSGDLVGSIVAYQLNRQHVVVRKEKIMSHSYSKVENIQFGNGLILDDSIDTGETLDRIKKRIADMHSALLQSLFPKKPRIKLDTVFFYNQDLSDDSYYLCALKNAQINNCIYFDNYGSKSEYFILKLNNKRIKPKTIKLQKE